MRSTTRILTIALGLVALLLISACGQQPAAPSAAKPDIVIGAAFPLTGIGANTGKAEAVGAQVAVDDLNAAGGIGGAKVKLVIMDTASNPQEAVNVVRKLTGDNKVLSIIGPHYSSEAEVTFPLGNQLKITQICVASSKPGLAAANRPFAFRNTLTEDKIADSVVAAVKAKGAKKVAIITDIKDAVSKSLGEAVFPAALKKAALEIVGGASPVTFQTGDADFSAQITKLKALNPDAIALGALGPDAISIMIEARRQGVKAQFFGGATLFEGEVEKKGGKDADGTIAGTVWYLEDPSEKNKKFVEAFRKKMPQMYSGVSPDPVFYAVNAYDGVMMIAEAVTKGGVTSQPADLEKDRDRIRDYFSKLNNFQGIASKGFDKDGDGIKDVKVLEIKGGGWAPLK